MHAVNVVAECVFPTLVGFILYERVSIWYHHGMTDYDLADSMKIHRVDDANLRDLLAVASRKARNIYKYSLHMLPTVEDDDFLVPASVPYTAYMDAARIHRHVRSVADMNDINVFNGIDAMHFIDGIVTPPSSRRKSRYYSRPEESVQCAHSLKGVMRNRGTMYNYCLPESQSGDYNVYAYALHVIDLIDDDALMLPKLFKQILMESVDNEYPYEFTAQLYMIRLDSEEKPPRSSIVNIMFF